MTSDVYNMDCMEYMRGLPDNAFDLVIADPPYGDAFQNKNISKSTQIAPPNSVENGTDSGKDLIDKLVARTGGTWAAKYGKKIIGWDEAPQPEFFRELSRVSRTQIIWGGNYFSLPPTRCFLVWEKTNIPENFTMSMCEYAWTSINGNAKLFKYSSLRNEHSGKFHPTEKPVELYAWAIKLFAKVGDRIFDPMMGSQSSMIAAYKMGYDYTGCEIDKEYFDKGCERFERECHGVETLSNGSKIIQQTLF